MLTIQEIIENYTTNNEFIFDLTTVMKSIRPGCLYEITSGNGEFILTKWPDNQWSDKQQKYIDPPTNQEIRDEYIRQKTIAEFLGYLKSKEDNK